MLKEIKDINKFAKIHHRRVVMKGYWREQREIGTLLMLIVTEISKLTNEYRVNKGEKLADVSLRILDLMTKYNYKISLENLEVSKLTFNCSEHSMIQDVSDTMELYRQNGKLDCFPLSVLLRRWYAYAFENEIDLDKEMIRKSRMIFEIKKRVI